MSILMIAVPRTLADASITALLSLLEWVEKRFGLGNDLLLFFVLLQFRFPFPLFLLLSIPTGRDMMGIDWALLSISRGAFDIRVDASFEHN